MTHCPLCDKPAAEISDYGKPYRWRCMGCEAVIVRTSADASCGPRVVTYRVESIEADRLIRESGCVPP